MARYTFSVSPDYLGDDDTDIGDVRYLQASLEYTLELPKDTVVTTHDLQYHFSMWLRGMGYQVDIPGEDDVAWSNSAMYTPPELDTATPGSW
jgi:hypothetical protein